MFKSQASTLIQKAMNEYNFKEFTEGITKQEAEYLNTKIEDKTLETMTLVNSKDVRADAVKNANINNIKEVQTQLTNILTSNDNIYEKSHWIQNLIIPSQNEFYYTVLKNKQNKDLSFQLSTQQKQLSSEFSQQKNLLETKITELNLQLNEIINELV